MKPTPRWFLPDGVTRPAHLPPGGIATRTGPTQVPGLVVGGPYRPDEPGWQDTGKGWLFHCAGCNPCQLLRLAPVTGQPIPGALPDHQWMIPHLLSPSPAGGLHCAMPQVLGPSGFTPPPAFVHLMEGLRAVLVPAIIEIQSAEVEQRPPALDLAEDSAVQLAIDLLAVNYHISRDELAALGWMTDRMVVDILFAAAGMAGGDHG